MGIWTFSRHRAGCSHHPIIADLPRHRSATGDVQESAPYAGGKGRARRSWLRGRTDPARAGPQRGASAVFCFVCVFNQGPEAPRPAKPFEAKGRLADGQDDPRMLARRCPGAAPPNSCGWLYTTHVPRFRAQAEGVEEVDAGWSSGAAAGRTSLLSAPTSSAACCDARGVRIRIGWLRGLRFGAGPHGRGTRFRKPKQKKKKKKKIGRGRRPLLPGRGCQPTAADVPRAKLRNQRGRPPRSR